MAGFQKGILLTLGATFLSLCGGLVSAGKTWEAIGAGAFGLACIFAYSYVVDTDIVKASKASKA